MEKEIFENGITLLYEYRNIGHSSFCIGLEAGANMEDEENIGVAHALEHFLFKGTKEQNEEDINKKIDELFGFSNAMTNFPYVIYYGTTFDEDFEKGFNLYSDIILNPSLTKEGFDEEISVIKQELSDWKEDLEQYCEDKLLENTFSISRLRKRIIGESEDISNITMEKLKNFHSNFYVSHNIVISVVTSMDFEEIKCIVAKKFSGLKEKEVTIANKKRIFNNDVYKDTRGLYKAAKIQKVFDISELSLEEIKVLRVFNMYFGEGVSSLLYDEIRTKRGLAYEVSSEVKWEKGIRLFSISISTTKDSVDEVIEAIEEILRSLLLLNLKSIDIDKLVKRYKMKSSLEIERSIVLANRMAINEILNDNGAIPLEECKGNIGLSCEKIKEVIKKVFKDASTQILL